MRGVRPERPRHGRANRGVEPKRSAGYRERRAGCSRSGLAWSCEQPVWWSRSVRRQAVAAQAQIVQPIELAQALGHDREFDVIQAQPLEGPAQPGASGNDRRL